VLVLVVVDEPSTGSHYGGTVAAPAAAEILRQTLAHLRVPPDEPVPQRMDDRADVPDSRDKH
jgi:cell division protein FtsI (penicillin-binding protein 3)